MRLAAYRAPAQDDIHVTPPIAPENGEDSRVVILIPVFNDWPALAKLLDLLDDAIAESQPRRRVQILVVNDGSSIPVPTQWPTCHAIAQVDVLDLRRNVGHQRAIAVGLAFIHDHLPCSAVLVMDGDGEDSPFDVPRLLNQCFDSGLTSIVFAERTKRSESYLFRLFYLLYRWAHRLLTGRRVRVGNFSAIPFDRLDCLTALSELWTHYPAAVFISRLPLETIPCQRAKRLDGRSKMNFVGLVIHGLGAISVYAEIMGVRLLVASTTLAALALLGLLVTASVRLFTALAIPGWATFTSGILLIVILQAVMFSLLFCFVILSGRQRATYLPLRDYEFMVRKVHAAVSQR